MSRYDVERFDTIVVGGGQAGLAVGYHLARHGRDFAILDAHQRVGDAWRTRWDSLRLFTPAMFDHLPGMRFPASRTHFPTKDEMADYLEAYARRFDLPVRTGVRVDALARNGHGFLVAAGDERFEADNVVVATSSDAAPRMPDFAAELDPAILQMHSTAYLRPSQLQDGAVLIVGAGNSGADIAMDVATRHRTLLSGRDVGHIPPPVNRLTAATIFPIIRFRFHHVMKTHSRSGRKMKPYLDAGHGLPLVRVKPKHLAAAGVERVARVAGVRDGRPQLEDGQVLDVANVIWCTGYRPDFAWIDVPCFGDDGGPVHERGVVTREPGLYFIGLNFLYAASSGQINGVGRDAKHVVEHLARNRGHAARSTGKQPPSPHTELTAHP
jgi:putative flavoprotein involved in K+ transport